MIMPSIVRWRRDLAKTSGCLFCPIGRGLCGSLAIPMPHSADADHALKDAREIGHAPTLMYALYHASWSKVFCRKLRDGKRGRR